jgi:hypothetical protein
MPMKMLLSSIVVLFAVVYNSAALESLLFEPPAAAVFEPRIGGMYQFGGEKLRLDIGASLDMAEIYNNGDTQLRLGADFFTYTRLRSQGRFKFPVETSDYFFGVNASYKKNYSGGGAIGARLRLSHISSHMVDGYTGSEWVFLRDPIVYSREFIDLLASCENETAGIDYRIYGGMWVIFSTIPEDVSLAVPQFGVDAEWELLDWLDFRSGFDCRIFTGGDITSPDRNQLSIQAGLALKTWDEIGVVLNYNWFNGKSIHGMFHDRTDFYNAVGFQLIFY